MLKKLAITTGLMVFSTVALCGKESRIDESSCKQRGGLYYGGVCSELSLSTEVSGALLNDFRYKGGNEASYGDNVIQFDARFSKEFNRKHLKTIFIDISAVQSEAVLNYLQVEEQNEHNENRFRADGYLDRPWLLANMGAQIDLTESQELTILAGSFQANGLQPLEGKTSRYYMNAPYGLIVRYDKGLQFNYELKDKIEKVLSASLSIIDGDGIKGQSSIEPSDSRANSYNSYSGSFELQVANALKKVFSDLEPVLKNQDLYMGVTGSYGETGSYDGEKRSQHDFLAYIGYMVKTKFGDGEIRVFSANYARNPIGNGSGGHVPLVNSKAKGVEFAVRNIDARFCDVDLYGNVHEFESNDKGPDGEFTWGNTHSVKGWTGGVSCRNFAKVDNLSAGVEYGRAQTYDSNNNKLQDEKIVNIVFKYKLGTQKKTKARGY